MKKFTMRRIFLGAATAIAIALSFTAVFASQNNLYNPTTGTLDGLNQVQNDNSAFDSVNTCNSGASAPTNQLSGVPSAGNCWYNISTGAVSYYDGTSWLIVGYIDATNHYWTGVVGGGNVGNIASASTTDLCSRSPPTAYVQITGSATITSFGSNCPNGTWRRIFINGGTPTITYNASTMILPTGANIVAASGDTMDVVYQGGVWIMTGYQRATGAALSSVGLNIGASALANSALAFGPVNVGLTASVASNALTVSVTGANGSAPSSVNPVLIAFKSPTGATGTPVIESLQASLGMTVSSTNTMGCSNGVMCRLWIFAIDNGGTLGLCLYNANAGGNSVLALEEGALQSSASGTGGGSSSQTLYCNISAVSGKAVKYLGYVEIQESAAGTWATGPTLLQLMGPGVHKPGDVLRTLVLNSTTANASVGATVTITGLTTSVTPQSAANLFLVRANGTGEGAGTGANTNLRLARSSAGTAPSNLFGNTGSAFVDFTGSGSMIAYSSMAAEGFDQPNTTSPVPYSAYVWGSGGQWLPTISGVTPSGELVIQEIMGALEPANDNGLPLRLVG